MGELGILINNLVVMYYFSKKSICGETLWQYSKQSNQTTVQNKNLNIMNQMVDDYNANTQKFEKLIFGKNQNVSCCEHCEFGKSGLIQYYME